MYKSLRSNLNETNAKRIAEGMNNVKTIVENTENNLKTYKGRSGSNKAKNEEAVKYLVSQMKQDNPFSETQNYNSYEDFPKFNSCLLKMDTRKTLKWIKKNRKTFLMDYPPTNK